MKTFQSLCAAHVMYLVFSTTLYASELSYTYLDFQWVEPDINLTGSQNPVPSQNVNILSRGGSGVSMAGSLALINRFFISGSFQSSIVDLDAVVTNPLGVTEVSDEHDLIRSRAAIGYLFEIGANFDIVMDVSYDTADFDFGSVAGENFDVAEGGAGAEVGFRWNPVLPFELFAAGRYSSVGQVDLNRREFESDTLFKLGLRWYFFEDLGLGFEFESGQIDTATLSMRFSFGNLPW